MTELQKKLRDELTIINDDWDFILGVLCYAETPEDQQAIIDFIDKEEDVTDQNILMLALYLENERNHPELNLNKKDLK